MYIPSYFWPPIAQFIKHSIENTFHKNIYAHVTSLLHQMYVKV